ncbi:hypothetical protein BX600DRAFT_483015 [Xylariales sp. PMI_506]|nr:hypothetical protein BX600DRAFT_483015 [Xylariales sp. PMI_506]
MHGPCTPKIATLLDPGPRFCNQSLPKPRCTMADELAQLREQLKQERRLREEEEQRRREQEQRLREEEQRRREEEQRLREEAEQRAKSSQPQTLAEYLESCHQCGETTNPVGRIYPRRIIPWDDFANRQEEIWGQLSFSAAFSSGQLFPSKHQMEYVMSLISPISSEIGLRTFERDSVENAVKKLVDKTYNDSLLRNSLDLQGTVTFESHTNLGVISRDISKAMQSMSLGEDGPSLHAVVPCPRSDKAQGKPRGKGNLADQFCVYRMSDGRNIPTLAIEYKAPHKLTRDEIVTGLQSEIQPDRDIINQDGQGFEFASKSLAAAVITQIFSYMIGKGIQYGYVNTGEAFVFLHIPEDPTQVYYSVCVPNLDVMDDDETRLHRTAVAQVFSFILQALRVEPPPQVWYDAATCLDTWAVEYDDTDRKKSPRVSPYKPQRWKGFVRSPIRTRSRRCQEPTSKPNYRDSDPDDDDDATPPSPTPKRSARTDSKKAPASTSEERRRKSGEQAKRNQPRGKTKQVKIMDRPYCTHKCLLGLAYALQQTAHRSIFPAIGSLFKVRLSSLGYTLVAKGMEDENLPRLRHEAQVYSQLRSIQGKHVPVSVGIVDLELPYYCDGGCNDPDYPIRLIGGIYTHFLLLSWAGRPLWEFFHDIGKDSVMDAVTEAYSDIHENQVVHGDPAIRNLLYDERTKAILIVDFERAALCGRTPLGLVSHNTTRKRKRGKSGKVESNKFGEELQSIIEALSTYK